ncbi:hypothetical protein, partial [Pantoea ananatis]|uniref:hypothetical protein n=1 Tax=Pantoea ananas TaxID=553 RepID=UPI0023B1034C
GSGLISAQNVKTAGCADTLSGQLHQPFFIASPFISACCDSILRSERPIAELLHNRARFLPPSH